MDTFTETNYQKLTQEEIEKLEQPIINERK